MTHEERAKQLASQLWHSEACEPSQLIPSLAAALAAVEKETWEQAAKKCEELYDASHDRDAVFYEALLDAANVCHMQARKE